MRPRYVMVDQEKEKKEKSCPRLCRIAVLEIRKYTNVYKNPIIAARCHGN